MPDENAKTKDQPRAVAGLLQRACRGDDAALELLLRQYRDRLLRVAKDRINPRLRRYFDEEDVVQQTSTEVFRRIKELDLRGDSETRFEAWLATVLTHALAERARKHSKRVERLASQILDEKRNSGPTASRIQRQEERRERLENAIAQLPGRYRVAIELQLKGLTQQEIARQLGLTKPAVNNLQARARQRLHEALGPTSLNLSSP